MKKKECDCVCHKLGYISCGGGCPEHPLWRAIDRATDKQELGSDDPNENPYRSQA